MENGLIDCRSCKHEVAIHREEAGMALCDICAPWVESSLRRTGEIPSWAPSFCDERQDMFYETRKAIMKFSKIREGRGHWSRGEGAPHPITERGWIQFLRYVMTGHENGTLVRIEYSIDIREGAIGLSNSVSAIQNHLRLADENTEQLFGHSIRLDGDSIWVNGVLFGPKACEIHCQNRRILPQLIFDRFNALDNRPIEEMAYVYMRGPWIQLIRDTTNARVPTSFALREEICRVADGTYGDEPADRMRSALLLWSTAVEREYLTCPPSAWARSFQWVREISEDFSADVEIAEDGIYVTGSSKNLYRISSTPPDGRSDRFEVCRILQKGETTFDQSQNNIYGDTDSVPICIHSMTSDEEDLERPLGDVIVSLILALRDDLQTAERIPQLHRHLPDEFQGRRRRGRHYWRERFREFERQNIPPNDANDHHFRQMRIAVRAARAALGELEEEE